MLVWVLSCAVGAGWLKGGPSTTPQDVGLNIMRAKANHDCVLYVAMNDYAA